MAKQAKKRQRPYGYWRKSTNVRRELRAWIKKHGHFPKAIELQRSGCSSLASALTLHHDGISAVRKQMGYEIVAPSAEDRAPWGYWQQWKNAKRVIRAFIKEHGHFPNNEELRSLRRFDVLEAIRHHGGFRRVREHMGFPSPRQPKRYWQQWKNAKRVIRAFIKEHGHFPGDSKLRTLGRLDILTAIRTQGGFAAVRKRMGYPYRDVRPAGYFKAWKNVERELRRWIKQHHHFPTGPELCASGLSSLAAAVSTYHGGMYRVRIRLGYAPSRTPPKLLRSWGYLEKELRKVIATLGHFPTTNDLVNIKRTDLARAIRYQGGFPAVCKKMGLTPHPKKEVGFWHHWPNVEHELKCWIAMHGRYPIYPDLVRDRKTSLVQAIRKYHGGFAVVRARMGYGRPIHNTSGFVRVLEREQPQKARRVIKDLMSHFGDDLVDVADILAVVYAGRLDSSTAMEILQDPTMRPWIVPFDGRGHGPTKPPIDDDFPFYLLEKDKNGVIAGIIRRRLTEWRRKVLGARPSQEARAKFLRELRELQDKFRTKGGKEMAPAA